MARKRAVSGGSTRSSSRLASKIGIATADKSKRMSSPGSPTGASPTKNPPRKGASRGKWSEEQLLTSDKSVLIDADLVKLLASSAAWNVLEEDEKREVLALLPPDTHPNPDPPADDPDAKIPPLPDSFVRYSNNWRDGIRQFQLDLQNGRYDPEWLRQADEARHERENGDFDSFKEREYEAFWGQKQKFDKTILAGESAKIKLGTLIEKGVVRVGDIWKFSYTAGRGAVADRIFIEKEARIQEINGSKLTFVMPAGQHVLLRSTSTDSPKPKSEGQESQPQRDEDKNQEPIPETPTESPPQQQNKLQSTAPSNQISNSDVENFKCEMLNDVQEEQNVGLSEPLIDAGNTVDWLKNEIFTSTPLSSPPPRLPSSPPDQSIDTKTPKEENQSKVQVVIFSPNKTPFKTSKRSIPQPAEEPVPKRKRGRPRKIPVSPVDSVGAKDPGDAKPQVASVSHQEHQPGPEPEFKPKPEPELKLKLKLDPEQDPAFHPPVQAAFESTSKLDPKPETTQEIQEPEQNVENAIASKQLDASAEINKPPSVIELPGPADIPMDFPMSTITNEPHISKNLQPALESPPEAASEVAMQTDPTFSSSQPVVEPSDNVAANDVYEEVIVRDVMSPSMLVLKILAVDGRRPDMRTANAWKELRCYRNNQDMGSLFDVRQAWYLKQN